jgi:catalase
MEPDRGYPQAGSAHDTFWDFASLMPESMHMLMWAMSDRAIPRSYRMIEGFGVHTFRFIDGKGKSTFVKFHWRPVAGAASVLWDEACKISGADPDFHRRDLFDAIARGDFPEWEFCIQAFDQKTADAFEFDVLDATKLIPEEDIPLEVIGKMVLNRNVDNFFAETEQVAFHPGHVVPGIDFTNDPLLQGRLFSYTDTQLIRLGGPNFHELEINRPRCPMRNFQRDGVKRQNVPTGRVAYEPNSLDPAGPRESAERGFATYVEQESGDKQRIRPEGFADLSLDERAGAASHRQRLRLRARQGRNRRDPQAHARPPDDHRTDLGRRGRGSARHGRRSRTAHAGARSDRSRRVARPEPDQEGEADTARPQGRRAHHRRRRRRRARCAPQRGREGRRRVRDRSAEDRRREDR